ncbi:class A beta-lactamase-related serine hydrolase [Bombilactobacillus folatiphilus]|uniref:Class A beta-lactamase-related serine hydrolase n=1 Tax=Bombilactobacillus folatiphilus TaxID=2923362 RepID=A0ABY4P759_9LACO|nr:serine hydrolase [Bombilactobacillus folatiphilus]UQS81465.1 class A beta-lactamase-related serine hydrolase [Bombilactobacillus folatiphilus]
MNTLKSKINQILTTSPFDYAIQINRGTDILMATNTQVIFSAASLIKLGIARYLVDLSQKNPDILQERLSFIAEQRVGGAGIIADLDQNSWLVEDLIRLMLSLSDNSATNLLLHHFTVLKIHNWLNAHYSQINLRRLMMQASHKHQDNSLTLSSLMQLWQDLFNDHSAGARIVQQALSHQHNQQKLVANKNQLVTYNKTGELALEEHDLARFQFTKQIIDCGILVHFNDPSQRKQAIKLIQQIGTLVINHFDC